MLGGCLGQTMQPRVVQVEFCLSALSHHAVTHRACPSTTLDAFQVEEDWGTMVRSGPGYWLV